MCLQKRSRQQRSSSTTTFAVAMTWPRSAYNVTSLRSITLREAGLPARMVGMLGDCPLVEDVELRDCRVRIATVPW